jgi:hypothetical protein
MLGARWRRSGNLGGYCCGVIAAVDCAAGLVVELRIRGTGLLRLGRFGGLGCCLCCEGLGWHLTVITVVVGRLN